MYLCICVCVCVVIVLTVGVCNIPIITDSHSKRFNRVKLT